MGKTEEAQISINKLIGEMKDSNMEDDILMLNSELALKGGDLKKSVNLLKKVSTKDENVFKQSRIKLANIYLTHLMERRLYTWCYIEILENFNTFENLKLVGNALMSIDSPDEAVEFFNRALQFKIDVAVMRDLGKALVKTHDYKRAIAYYLESLKDFSAKLNNNNVLTYYEIAEDFVAVMFKLASSDINKSYNLQTHLENFIEKLSGDIKKYDDYQLKKKLAYFKFIFSKALRNIFLEDKNSIESKDIYKSLEESLKITKEVISKLRELKNEAAIKDEKEILSEICFEIGKYYEVIDSQPEYAEKAFMESVNNNPNNEAAIYSLSNLFLKKNSLSEAHKYADMLLRLNESNEDAIKLLITIINSKKSNDFTITYLENILEKQPLSFKLIEIYIDIVKRVGKLNKAKDNINKCDKKLKYTYSPGLNYCKGLYFRAIGKINQALQEFSKSKTDEYYGVKCLEQMLEIYINPDNNIILIDLEPPLKGYKGTSMLNYQTEDINIDGIKFLLKELKIRRNDEKVIIYDAYLSILLKDKKLIEKAVNNLQDILNKDKENITAWVALAMANLVTLKFHEVKTNLKVIERANLNAKYADDFERGLLIYAHMMILTENDKKAEELLQRVINEINVSQSKLIVNYS
jgi:tetratricopeptide (TPR) repeat protein